MLKLGVSTANLREILGQMPRLVLAVPSSALGLAPTGNVGSTRVNMFRPMEIEEGLRVKLEAARG